MVLVPSTMLPLGTPIIDFRLPDAVSGRLFGPGDFADAKGILVAFICNHCPYVKHIRAEFARFAKTYAERGIVTLAINSNDFAAYPDDAPDKMAEEARAAGYTFPYLIDADQTVAHAYQAACTPDLFLFDGARALAYRGQFDDARPSNGKPVTGIDLRGAADLVLVGAEVPEPQKPATGCNIKWKPGNAPAWFSR